MKISHDKNKIAPSLLQNLPPSDRTEMGPESVEPVEVKTISGPLEQAREIIREILVADWMAQPIGFDFENVPLAQTISPLQAAAARVERLGLMIHHEVFTLHQTGARALGVSIPLDAQTEIFLSLTQNAGEIHAAFRCDEGDLTGLENYWAQLQESLARHNVRLAAMEHSGKNSAS